MDMRVSDSLENWLSRKGMRGVGLQSGRANEVADAAGGGEPHRPTAGREGQPMGMRPEKRRGDTLPRQFQEVGESASNRPGRTGDSFLRLVADNVDVMPTRQSRANARLSLVCIEGGR